MMRLIDRLPRLGRRRFLRGGAGALPATALLAGGVAVSATQVWAEDAKALKPGSAVTLVRVARDIYPHDRIPDIFYARAVLMLDAAAVSDNTLRDLLEEGVMRLDADARDRFQNPYLGVASESDRVALLEAISAGAFFKKVHGALTVSFYNQHELWPRFGYEGSSAEYGGYIHRGFDDIDWLPKS